MVLGLPPLAAETPASGLTSAWLALPEQPAAANSRAAPPAVSADRRVSVRGMGVYRSFHRVARLCRRTSVVLVDSPSRASSRIAAYIFGIWKAYWLLMTRAPLPDLAPTDSATKSIRLAKRAPRRRAG